MSWVPSYSVTAAGAVPRCSVLSESSKALDCRVIGGLSRGYQCDFIRFIRPGSAVV
jgi:hypothetical protein